MHDVVVVGGGVIGLSIAREAAGQGNSVLVLERGAPGEGTSWAAAGMLAPQSEADSDGPFFRLCMASLGLYRKFADCLRGETGIDPEYAEPGLLFLASSEEELMVLKQRCDWQRASGLAVEILRTEEVRAMEPQITMPLAGAVLMPGEHHVTPRRLVKSLIAACRERKVEIRSGQRVDEILATGNRVEGVRAGGARIQAGHVVMASGVWSSEIAGLAPRIPVFPRKGQILSLEMPGRMFGHMIRWGSRYLVPRRGGELVLGATSEDTGFDRRLTPEGIGGLLADAQCLSSHLVSYPILEMWAGLRPATPDGLPVLGTTSIKGLLYAAGHFRNGILLAPITASVVTALLAGGTPQIPLEAFRPDRFEV